MKKLFPFLLTVLLFSALTRPVNAQTEPNPATDPEKIYLFDSAIQVFQNGTIQVTETITLNVKHRQIRRGIYRDIPTSFLESANPVSLTMDQSPHPFFTERKSTALRVNFGNDSYIPQGQHTYVFTYTFTGAVDFYKNYNELYWNVTGNDWDFTIDKARVQVTFPAGTHIQADGISTYTGPKGSKNNHAQQTSDLSFETTRPLYPREGFTLAVPFDKGMVQKPSFWNRLDTNSLTLPVWISLVCSVLLFVYFLITWLQVGKDPAYVSITQYEPPLGVSPAFMYYLQDQSLDSTLMVCALVDLAMKGYIEIQEKKEFLSSTKAVITLLKQPTPDLPKEEQNILHHLFPVGNTVFLLNTSSTSTFEEIRKVIRNSFKEETKKYILSNLSYVGKAGVLVAILGILPFILIPKGAAFIFTNCHFAVFFLLAVVFVHRLWWKILVGIGLTAFYSAFWFAILKESAVPAAICQLLFLFSFWGFAFYVTLIRNVTPAGKELFAQIYGFKKYMEIAEVHRVAASNPLEAERIFCNFLPFAFALGIENKWMKKFQEVLSKETVERCTACAGGARFLSNGLASSIRSSGGGGSHGGGHSGGGHGGGGGGGR